jgi:AraC-like DNA-binding protein
MCDGPDESTSIEGSGERWHAHRAVELTFIESGEGIRFVGDNIGTIEPPELVLIGTNLPHYWNGLENSSGVAAQFEIDVGNGLHLLPEIVSLNPILETAQHGVLFDTDIAAKFGNRLRQMSTLDSLSRLAELLKVLAELSDEVVNARPLSQKSFTLTATSPNADEISHAVSLLTDHFQEDLTVDDICQAVGLSRATLSRCFRKYTGRSLIDFLNSVRIDHACRLLIETSESIGDIAFQSGFSNLSHFNRQFRRTIGHPPREYRHTNRPSGYEPDELPYLNQKA